jgi:hypothetical protein
MRSFGTNDVRTAQLTMPELNLPSQALMPAATAVARIPLTGFGQAHRLLQPVMNRIGWRRRGEVCLRSRAAAADVQGARVAGFGGYDVTDTKFSIRLGPPSCSPPV